jgi:hypothetical protein
VQRQPRALVVVQEAVPRRGQVRLHLFHDARGRFQAVLDAGQQRQRVLEPARLSLQPPQHGERAALRGHDDHAADGVRNALHTG